MENAKSCKETRSNGTAAIGKDKTSRGKVWPSCKLNRDGTNQKEKDREVVNMNISQESGPRYATVLLGRNQRMRVAAIHRRSEQVTLQESDKVFLTVPMRCVIFEEEREHGQG